MHARRFFYVSLGILTLAILIGACGMGPGAAPPQQLDRWQYMVVGIDDGDWTTRPDSLGGLGWELVSTRRAERPETESEVASRVALLDALNRIARTSYAHLGVRNVMELDNVACRWVVTKASSEGVVIPPHLWSISSGVIPDLTRPHSVPLYECIFKRRVTSGIGL